MSPDQLPTVVISRRSRHLGDNWAKARSWLGGAPRLGDMPWPRDNSGRSLHFFAQLDLAELYAALGPSPLPDTGSLAFFAGTVVFVPDGQAFTPTAPPSDLPPLSEVGGASHYFGNTKGEPLSPFWPIEFTPIELPVDSDRETRSEAQQNAISKRFVRRKYNLTAKAAFAGPPLPRWWQNALHFARHLADRREQMPTVFAQAQKSLDWSETQLADATAKDDIKKFQSYIEMNRQKLAAYDRLQPAFLALVDEILAWTSDRDPWTPMSDADWQKLVAYRARQPEFGDFTQYWGDPGIEELRGKTFDALPKEGTPEFESLPEAVQTPIRAKRAPRPKWWHSAWLMADQLGQAAETNVPRVVEKLTSEIDADRTRLRRLSPGGALAPLWSMLGGKSQEVTKLEAGLVEKEAKLAAHSALAETFHKFVLETTEWARKRDPWRQMTTDEWDELSTRFKRGKDEFKAFAAWVLPYSPESLEDMTIVTLLSAEERGYATLPEPVRDLVNTEYLLPTGGCHQMFGEPTDVQGNAVWEHEQDYLLLQLSYDDLMHWSFGDNGVYQFWISPEELAKRNWATAAMTFECH